VRPDVATFGRKDYQQLAVLRALVADLCVPVRIMEVPTKREPDGLAMSSRNAYLDENQRRSAPGLFEALKTAEGAWLQGQRDPARLEEAMRAVLGGYGFDASGSIDYAAVRDPATLGPFDADRSATAVALIAARLGATRLIDNLPLS
ncbi:MAG: pantoate--beta-alanine ligase, partial [Planctomycetota bacterium]